MTTIGRTKQQVGSGVVLKMGDGGSPEQFHEIGELIDFGTPGFQERVKELTQKIEAGHQPTTEDFWALTGVPISARLKRMAKSAGDTLAWLRVERPDAPREHHAAINRHVVDALQHLQSLASPPPSELIALIAEQLQVSGKPRCSRKDNARVQKAVALIAENPDISDRAAARSVGADHKTIRRWRTSQDFLQAVHSYREQTTRLKTWTAMQARKPRGAKEANALLVQQR